MFRRKNNRFGNSSNIIRSFLAAHIRELLVVLSGAFILFLFICILSFNPQDASHYSFSSAQKIPTNWCGSFGALLAATLLHFFGLSALFALIFASILLVLFFRRGSISTLGKEIVGCACVWIGFLIVQNFFTIPWFYRTHSGLLSVFLYDFLVFYSGVIGAFLSALSSIWIGGLLIFNRSIFASLNSFFFMGNLIAGYAGTFIGICFNALIFCYQYAFGGLKALIRLLFSHVSHHRVSHHEDTADKLEVRAQLPLEHDIVIPENTSNMRSFLVQACVLGTPYKRLTNFSFLYRKDLLEALSSLKLSYDQKKIEIPFILPDASLFRNKKTSTQKQEHVRAYGKEQARKLEEKLASFGIKGEVSAIAPGPVVTLFEYSPAVGTKVSKIVVLEDDLAMALKAKSIRIRAPIPGRSVIGFEIANDERCEVLLSDVIRSFEPKSSTFTLPLALGVDIVGRPIIEDLLSMPHLLVAGSTGSGKSVGLNSMLMSLLCARKPMQMRLILIDPKRLEFAAYKDIPHLLFPIVTDPRTVAPVLKWVVGEMERRYEKMAIAQVRNLSDYRALCEKSSSYEELPFIVVVIDELADLMMVAGKEIETLLARISQMARAAGIHVIVATQRPSVDVLTGIIKVNFPSRISFRVSSKVDSKTIMDSSGAEKLLGRGDMLLMMPTLNEMLRLHGAYVSDEEISALANHLRAQGRAQYLDLDSLVRQSSAVDDKRQEDELYNEVLVYLESVEDISISMLQRKYRIGFNRSARLIEQLEADGVIAPAQGSKPRKVLRLRK